jgi:hypothetical protein
MPSIYYNTLSDKKIKAATGLTSDQFNKLAIHFEKHYIPKKANPWPNTKQPVLTDKKEALFFILHYLKAYPTLENMGLYFDMDIRTVSNYISYTKAALKAALKESDSLLPYIFRTQEEFDKAFEGIEDIIVDCTEIQVQRSKDSGFQEYMYSGKKKLTPLSSL